MTFGLRVCVAVLSLAPVVHGGLFDRKPVCGEPCAGAWISRPCRFQVTGHQRQNGGWQSVCGSTACGESSECCPVAEPDCCAPVVPDCCAPVGPACCVPVSCHEGDLCDPEVSGRCSVEGCGSSAGCQRKDCCCVEERCEVAKLIRQSMHACYARQRRNAVHQLSDYYDLCCHPAIMDALVYALNDSDERVRAKAADEIGDQIRRHGGCVNSDVICVLRYSLGDCDKRVRRQAEEALQLCGYRIVDGHCCCPAEGGHAALQPVASATSHAAAPDSATPSLIPPPLPAANSGDGAVPAAGDQ